MSKTNGKLNLWVGPELKARLKKAQEAGKFEPSPEVRKFIDKKLKKLGY